MGFHVGQKVVCVDVRRVKGYEHVAPELRIRSVYTIRWTGPSPHPLNFGEAAVQLEEIIRPADPNPFHRDWDDMPFAAWRFRPVIERKTDISVFTRMLNPSDRKVVEQVK